MNQSVYEKVGHYLTDIPKFKKFKTVTSLPEKHARNSILHLFLFQLMFSPSHFQVRTFVKLLSTVFVSWAEERRAPTGGHRKQVLSRSDSLTLPMTMMGALIRFERVTRRQGFPSRYFVFRRDHVFWIPENFKV